jgi:hypothetical protein
MWLLDPRINALHSCEAEFAFYIIPLQSPMLTFAFEFSYFSLIADFGRFFTWPRLSNGNLPVKLCPTRNPQYVELLTGNDGWL